MGVDPFPVLAEATLAASLAILLVLALRRPVRAALGAGAAYALWLCVPVALAAVLLPRDAAAPLALPVAWQVVPAAAAVPVEPQAGWSWREALAPLWLAGALVSAAWLGRQQRRFRRALGPLRRRTDGLYQSAMATAGLPAVAGVLRPRILLPEDFERRYTAQEQQLVLEHERAHVRRGDLLANALAALLRCLFWFNPLLAFAQARFRLDQELACDARVIARHPRARRQYGEALLKTQFHELPLPLGCHWQARHPIRERIDMLRRPVPSPLQWMAATLLALALSAAAGYTAWAAQPPQASTPATADAPDASAYAIDLRLDVDGNARSFRIHERAGRPFAVRGGDAASPEWDAELAVKPLAGPGTVWIGGHVRAAGQPVAEPAMVVGLGHPAKIQISTPDGRSVFTLELRVTPLDAPGALLPAPLDGDAPPAADAGAAVPAAAAAAGDRGAVASDRLPAPRYPEEAARQRLGGRVMLLVTVREDGSVADVQVEDSAPAGVFEAATLEAARQWRFEPALEQGKPVQARVRVPVEFEIPAPAGGTQA